MIDYDLTLVGGSLTLRPLRPGDAADIQRYVGDARIASKLASVPYPYPEGAAVDYLVRMQDPGSYPTWVITRTDDAKNAMIGQISLKPDENTEGEVGYWVAPEFWGQGIASQALALIIAQARKLGITKLRANVHQNNPASARVLIKAGFEYLGEKQEYATFHDREVPVWRYAMAL